MHSESADGTLYYDKGARGLEWVVRTEHRHHRPQILERLKLGLGGGEYTVTMTTLASHGPCVASICNVGRMYFLCPWHVCPAQAARIRRSRVTLSWQVLNKDTNRLNKCRVVEGLTCMVAYFLRVGEFKYMCHI